MRKISYNIWNEADYIHKVNNLLYNNIFGVRKSKANYAKMIEKSISDYFSTIHIPDTKINRVELINSILVNNENDLLKNYKTYYYSNNTFEKTSDDYYIALYIFFRSTKEGVEFISLYKKMEI